ncbi:SDR family NAD(P)-dependent oxidoreductase [Actinocorallia sp. A-T 12471]|uniref:SDR family NAD(P)-dependent oxidoreductase n=1 Tax=Actinocorallia sp. A-T 12471 TaxID=3089813 RepID=UPI0029D33944|nr:SDR family NAD(P)-dependent oxidoreductase [Actinocorallia sp. A-T 12471]MDX6741432.1 SDR family NAD(P)-dependent oxidoreductase [Actinocorallia sp. A-T 12471]
MRTYVITGGTDGMGRGLALRFLERGDRVIAVASGKAKGEALLAEAGRRGAGGRAEFVRADLSTVAGMRDAVAKVASSADAVDGLVFGAQRYASQRVETEDGLEFTFALAYLSRYVLGHGLLPHLEKAEAPVVMNLAGPGGLPGTVHWDDLQLTSGYRGRRAAMQSSRLNDLLGVAFPLRHPAARTRYVMYNPGFVRTGMADPLPIAFRLFTKAAALVAAQPVSRAIVPIAALVDAPPAEPLSAFMRSRRLPLEGADFDPERALRLDSLTARLLDAL